jgi:type I restriction enzyme R subunit
MKGRGVRIVANDDLWKISSQGDVAQKIVKDHFVIVDAVGVCEECKTESKPLDRKPFVPLEKLMNLVATGVADPDVASTVAARLARLDRQLNKDQRQELAGLAGGSDLHALTAQLLQSIDADAQTQKAVENFHLPPGQAPTDQQLDKVEQEMVTAALRPFHNPRLRTRIVEITKALEQVIDEITQDQLLEAGFSPQAKEKAKALVKNFRQFIEDNKEELEAIQLLYSHPHRAGLRYRHVKDLAAALKNPPLSATPERVWQAFEAIEPEKVKAKGGKPLVDLIALVRHALDPALPLAPYAMTVEERFRDWLTEKRGQGLTFTPEQRQWLDAIKDHIAGCLRIEMDDFEDAPFNQFGGLGRAHEVFGGRLNELLDDLNVRLAA